MIRQTIRGIVGRISDVIIRGRNRSMIIIGTDRRTTPESGYGDGGDNDVDSSSIDLVAGYDADSEDVSLQNDKSRIYIAEKTDPDSYFGINVGTSVSGAPAIVGISDNIYLKSRKKIKIVNDNVTINIDEDGNLEIEATKKAEIKVGGSKLLISDNGNIELDAGQGIAGRIVTHLDSCVGTDPVTGGEIISTFVRPTAVVNNTKVFIK